jgi:hypothetical protein
MAPAPKNLRTCLYCSPHLTTLCLKRSASSQMPQPLERKDLGMDEVADYVSTKRCCCDSSRRVTKHRVGLCPQTGNAFVSISHINPLTPPLIVYYSAHLTYVLCGPYLCATVSFWTSQAHLIIFYSEALQSSANEFPPPHSVISGSTRTGGAPPV